MPLIQWHNFVLTLLTIGLGGVVWLIRLEARVNYLDKMVEKQASSAQKLEEQINTHFLRLEGKVDRIALRCSAFHSDMGYVPRLDDENGKQ
jgi:uncharacterized membrane protein YqgA involved in biofilm formation